MVKCFDDLEFRKLYDGVQCVLEFGNSFELSIVQHGGSYGSKQGLYEIAVFENGRQKIMPGITENYDTVKGYLSKEDVTSIIKKMISMTGVSGVIT
jgi:hypothetical protein